jgi:two-component system sensor histidine kinase ChvG
VSGGAENERSRVAAAPSARFSLRIRVIVAILLAAVAPQLIVFVWSQLDRNVPGRMWRETFAAALEAQKALSSGADGNALSALARRHRVRLRLVDREGNVTLDVDADDPADRFGRFEEMLFGASASTLRELDETLGPLPDRNSVRAARERGDSIACDTLPLLYCEGARVESTSARLVHVQRSSRRAVQSVYALRAQLVRLSVITIPLALVIAIYTGRRIVRPVEHLRRQALARAATASPSAALDPERRDEVGALAEAFNALLDALDRKRRENEAFVADLVHELKNPVAAVRASAETLGAGAVDEERAARLARVLGDSSGKLDQLVSQFLELARADAGMPNEERSTVAVVPLLEALAARMRDDPRFADVTFTVSAPEPARVYGVAHRLDALFRELYENGASFAGPGGKLEVSVRKETTEVVVSFHDSGPGIAATDLPRVFDRFFTTRGARRGTGLGLALVRAVARAHGGDVDVTSDGGATFSVRLPTTP